MTVPPIVEIVAAVGIVALCVAVLVLWAKFKALEALTLAGGTALMAVSASIPVATFGFGLTLAGGFLYVRRTQLK